MALALRNLPINAGYLRNAGSIPWRRKRQLTPVFLPGESHGQRSLVGYSSWGHRVGHYWRDLYIYIYIYTLQIIHIWKITWKAWDTGSKITAYGDCSHEIKRPLLLERKAMTNLDSILKSRDITLPTKVHIVKAMVFPVVMYRCEN